MNMLDTRKTTRGITLWREDIIKYDPKNHGGRPISEFIRDLFHSRMQKYDLTEANRYELARQVEEAGKARQKKLRRPKAESPTMLGRRLAFSEAITIPAKVRKSPRFVKGK